MEKIKYLGSLEKTFRGVSQLSSNIDNFSQQNYLLLQKHHLHYKMLHVSYRKGHHQARINKKEGSQLELLLL